MASVDARARSAAPAAGGSVQKASPPDPYGFEVIDWAAWEEANSDMIAWIQVPGTDVSHPVMAGSSDDPTYYLGHDWEGRDSFAGALFLDAECAGDLDAGAAPIYGHHISGTTSMFTPLERMTEAAWAQEHSTVLIQTKQWRRVYEVSHVRVVNAAEPVKFCVFPSAAAFGEWYESDRAAADVALPVGATPDRAVQLVTCSYSTYRNERTVITCIPRVELPPAGEGSAAKHASGA